MRNSDNDIDKRRVNDRLWLTWERQTRNRSLSQHFDTRLIEIDTKFTGGLRYAYCIIATAKHLITERPNVLFAQNPSVFLGLVAALFCKFTNHCVFIDAHNSATEISAQAGILGTLTRWSFRNVCGVFVSNDTLIDQVERAGGRAVVLPDPLPALPTKLKCHYRAPPHNGAIVVFICSWSDDEPYLEVLRAATRAPKRITWYITGKSKGKETEFDEPIPDNVVLTGFISDTDYFALLLSANVTVDLTTRQNCLVCGAYESVACGTPMVLSDTPALRSYFSKGAVFTDHSAENINAAVSEALARETQLRQEVTVLAKTLKTNWQRTFEKIDNQIRKEC